MRLFFLFVSCAILRAQNSSIQGIVVNAADQQPLAGVHVRLVNLGMSSMAAYGAISDRTGHFSMASVPPGAYIPYPEFTGFVPAPQKSERIPMPANVEVKAGQPINDLKIELVRRAVIAGRVVDDAGDPVPYANVQVTSENGDPLPIRLFGTSQSQTNALGEFHLSGAPGKYFVKATPNPYNVPQIAEIRTDGSSTPLFTTTYFPSAGTVERASVVEVAAGEDKINLEIRLNRQQSLTLSGIVSGIPNNGSQPQVSLQYADDGKTFWMKSTVNADAGGHFTFTKLQAGAYRLMAAASGSAKLVSPVQETHLDRADATNLELALTAGVELNGTLQLMGDSTVTKRAVRLVPAGTQFPGVTPPAPALTDEHGAFHFTGVPPHTFTVAVEPLPEDAYVKDVMEDGVAVKGPIDLSRGRNFTIKVVAGRGAGQISGTIRDRDGQPIPGHPLIVLLTQDPKSLKRENMTMASPVGTYEIKGVRPGKYRLFAVDALKHLNMKGVQDLQPLAEVAEEIEIKESAKMTKDLTPVEKEGK